MYDGHFPPKTFKQFIQMVGGAHRKLPIKATVRRLG